MKKITIISALVMVAVLMGPGNGFAQTTATTTTTLQAQIDLITQLTKQIQALQAQIVALQQQSVQLQQQAVQVAKELRKGISGDDVKTLQIVLAGDPELYPEKLITGFYGALTEKAVRKFQKKYGIFGEDGKVSRKTLEKINDLLEDIKVEEHDDDDEEDEDEDDDEDNDRKKTKKVKIKNGCVIVPPGHLIAKGWLKKNEAPVVLPCQLIPEGILKKWREANGTSTPPTATSTDTTAPVISGLTAMDLTHNSVAIHWVTNEVSNSEVRFGTSTAYGLTSVTSTAVLTHHVVLSGLAPLTTYYYMVQSKDAAGNMATSSNQTFTTLATPADTAAPVISSITITNVSSTTATANWTTNEAATSKVYYGTTQPLNLLSASSTQSAALVTAHSLNLTGLTASSTYYAVLESKDSSTNTAISIQQTFTTSQ